MRTLITFLIILLTIIGCEPIEVKTQDEFDFTIKSERQIEGRIDMEMPTTINVIPERTVEGTAYYFSYNIIEGSGYYKLGNETLVPDQLYEIQNLQLNLKYIARIDGVQNIITTFKNDKNISKDHRILYNIEKETDFDFTISFDKEENYVNENTSFTIRLNQDGNDALIYKAYFQDYEGELTLDDGNEIIKPNQLFELNPGSISGKFKSTVVQNRDLEFVVKASNGAVKSQVINFKTLLTDFDVVMTPNPLAAPYQSDLNFTYFIKLPNNLEQEIEYFLYITSVGMGDLAYKINGSDDIISQGFEWSIGNRISNAGLLKQLGVVSPRSGVVTFHFRDSNGAEFEITINTEFQDN